MPQNLLEQLRTYTVVVADTGDIDAMEKFRPQDATTNPSLITAAAQMPQYQPIVDGVLLDARKELGASASRPGRGQPGIPAAGHRLRQEDPGHCAGPRLDGSGRAPLLRHAGHHCAGARHHCAVRRGQGIGRDHVLIKIASTWEGIRAAEVLENEGIHCNLTLLFGIAPGHCGSRSRRHAGLALRGPHSGLVQEGHRQGLTRAPTIPACIP